jgi:hypothetical protein
MPLVALICNTSYELASLTYLNGKLGFFIFLLVVPLFGIASFCQARNIFDSLRISNTLLILAFILMTIMGACLTFVSIISGGYTIS